MPRRSAITNQGNVRETQEIPQAGQLSDDDEVLPVMLSSDEEGRISRKKKGSKAASAPAPSAAVPAVSSVPADFWAPKKAAKKRDAAERFPGLVNASSSDDGGRARKPKKESSAASRASRASSSDDGGTSDGSDDLPALLPIKPAVKVVPAPAQAQGVRPPR